jgi:hypothetical protein
LPFECINFFEKNKEFQRILCKSSFGFKASLFLLFKLGYFSAITCAVIILVTIVTPHVGPPRILRRLAYTTGNWTWTIVASDLLQVLQILEVRKDASQDISKMSMLTLTIASYPSALA